MPSSSHPFLFLYFLLRKVALNALHTFSSDGGGGGGISLAPFSPLSISRAAAARAAIVISTGSDFLDETWGYFQLQRSRHGERMRQETARGKSKRRENCEMGRWRETEGEREGDRGREGGRGVERERGSHFRSRERDVEKGQLRD